MSDVFSVLPHTPLDSALEGISTAGSCPCVALGFDGAAAPLGSELGAPSPPSFPAASACLLRLLLDQPPLRLPSVCVQQLLHPGAPSGLERVAAPASCSPRLHRLPSALTLTHCFVDSPFSKLFSAAC